VNLSAGIAYSSAHVGMGTFNTHAYRFAGVPARGCRSSRAPGFPAFAAAGCSTLRLEISSTKVSPVFKDGQIGTLPLNPSNKPQETDPETL